MTTTPPQPTPDAPAEEVVEATERAVAAMPSTALTSIERDVFPLNLGGTVQGVKAEWFSRGYETALSSSAMDAVRAEALRAVVERCALTIPDVLGYKVPAVMVEDLLDTADEYDRAAALDPQPGTASGGADRG